MPAKTERIVIRPGAASDVPAIRAVDLSAGELFAGTHMAWAVGQVSSEAQLAAAIASDTLWVAEADGSVAAYLMAGTMDGCFYIDEVAVHRRAQGRGIGAALIDHALRAAAARGFRQATLTTDRTLPWNAPYYVRLGFRILDESAMPPRLAAKLAGQPDAHRRCAMIRDL